LVSHLTGTEIDVFVAFPPDLPRADLESRGLALGTIGQDYFDIDLFPYAGSFPLADAYRVRAHQVNLQLADLFACNTDIAQLTDSGRDRVRELVVGDEGVNHDARSVYGFARVGIEQYGATRI